MSAINSFDLQRSDACAAAAIGIPHVDRHLACSSHVTVGLKMLPNGLNLRSTRHAYY